MRADCDFLFVTASESRRAKLDAACVRENLTRRFASGLDAALSEIDSVRFKAVFVDAGDPELRGLQVLEWLKTRAAFFLTGLLLGGEADGFTAGLRLGATTALDGGLIDSPPDLASALRDVSLKWRCDADLGSYRAPLPSLGGEVAWVGRNAAVRRLLEVALAGARHDGAALIRGESGSGMRQLARVMASARPGGTVWFEAATLPVAEQNRIFLEKLAAGPAQPGRLAFFADVEALAPDLQDTLAALLRGGAAAGLGPRVKIVAASAADLDFPVREGRFREDLRLALEQTVLVIPPLRERKEDVALLAAHFLDGIAHGGARYFSDDTAAALASYDWPGNVAELEQVVAEAAARSSGTTIRAKDLPPAILEKSFYVKRFGEASLFELSYGEAKKMALNKFNREYIFELMSRSGNNLTVAAEKAGMDRSNFKKIVKKHFPDEKE